MTVERPVDRGEVWLVNATMGDADFYVNDHTRAADVAALTIGPELHVKGDAHSPYGVYTLSARWKGRPDTAPLAAASVQVTGGLSCDAVLHRTPDGDYRISIYENPFDPPSDGPGLIVRHVAHAGRITWRFRPKDDKPEIPVDERSGELANGQWQMATAVVQNDYWFEVLVDGVVVALHPDLELEHEKTRVIHVGGSLEPDLDQDSRSAALLEQELQIARGPIPAPVVTAPAGPLSDTDDNQPIEMTCPPVSVWQTHAASTQVTAVDPDGRVTDLDIAAIEPDRGKISIGDHSVIPAMAIGDPATADVDLGADLPSGMYEVTIVANSEGLGARATCALAVEVRPITLARLDQVIDENAATGAIEPALSEFLLALLVEAQTELNDDDIAGACAYLKDLDAQVNNEKGKAITEAVATQLDREISALRTEMGCG
jgi:hypothetical protein